VSVKCTAKPTYAATNPVVISLYVADEENVVEMTPQIPGQINMGGEIQETPPILRVIKTA